MLLVHQNTGKENRYGKNVFAVIISTLGRFDRANKKIRHIHFKEVTLFFGSRVEATLCDVHSEMKRNESYRTMLSSGTVYYAVHVERWFKINI